MITLAYRSSLKSSPEPPGGPSDVDALDLVERDLVGQLVVELRGPCRGVARDPHHNLKVAPVARVFGDPRPTEAVRVTPHALYGA